MPRQSWHFSAPDGYLGLLAAFYDRRCICASASLAPRGVGPPFEPWLGYASPAVLTLGLVAAFYDRRCICASASPAPRGVGPFGPWLG